MTIKQRSIKVTQNIYDNYRGYVSGEPIRHLGCNDFDAKLFLHDQLLKGGTIHPSSHFTAQDIAKFAEQLAK